MIILMFGILLSYYALSDEFMGVSFKAFVYWPVMLALLVISILLLVYQINQNATMVSPDMMSVLVFAMMSFSLLLTFLPFLVIGGKNVIVSLYHLLMRFDVGPTSHKGVERYLSMGEYDKALHVLMRLERDYPTNRYINEKLLLIYEFKQDRQRCLDKLFCLCRFHFEAEAYTAWIEKAHLLDTIAASQFEKNFKAKVNRD